MAAPLRIASPMRSTETRSTTGGTRGQQGTPSRMRLRLSIVLAAMLAVASARAQAEAPTIDPSAWRPLAYANLQNASADTATYMDIWKDAIDRNNRDYRARGDERFGKGNAPAIEAHFVIWSPRRSVVLSILDTAIACSVKAARPEARATVKLCPMRIAIYDGLLVETMDGGQACFLELESPPATDPAASAAYASYDIATKTIRIGMILNHSPVEGCSVDVPLQQR